MSRLTKRIVNAAKPDAHRDVFLWDSELRGLGLRVKPNGKRSFFIQYRNRNGRSRRFTIGQYGRLTPDEARRQAQKFACYYYRRHGPRCTTCGRSRGDDSCRTL